jgi:hypothetical protein
VRFFVLCVLVHPVKANKIQEERCSIRLTESYEVKLHVKHANVFTLQRVRILHLSCFFVLKLFMFFCPETNFTLPVLKLIGLEPYKIFLRVRRNRWNKTTTSFLELGKGGRIIDSSAAFLI